MKCTKIYNAREQQLFCSLNLLFGDGPVAVAVVVCLRWLTTVLMKYKSTIFNSFEKGSKLFFPSLFKACLSLLPFYVKFEQLNVNKWPK